MDHSERFGKETCVLSLDTESSRNLSWISCTCVLLLGRSVSFSQILYYFVYLEITMAFIACSLNCQAPFSIFYIHAHLIFRTVLQDSYHYSSFTDEKRALRKLSVFPEVILLVSNGARTWTRIFQMQRPVLFFHYILLLLFKF